MEGNLIRSFKLSGKAENNPFPTTENGIIHSKTLNFEHQYNKPTLSLKYTIRGKENYRINGSVYGVEAEEYLLVNSDREYAYFSGYKNTMEEGLCLYLNMNMLRDVCRVLTHTAPRLLDNPFYKNPSKPEFLEKVYKAKENELGLFLKEVATFIQNQPNQDLPNSHNFYYTAAEKLIFSQQNIFNQLNKLKTVKNSTKKELYRRLEIGKDYIENNYHKKIDIEEVSRAAAISEYHFFRTFKQVYGISPYKYLLQKRLEKAIELLKNSRCSVTETAYLTGFSDIHSFSKTFKKEFSISPVQLLQEK